MKLLNEFADLVSWENAERRPPLPGFLSLGYFRQEAQASFRHPWLGGLTFAWYAAAITAGAFLVPGLDSEAVGIVAFLAQFANWPGAILGFLMLAIVPLMLWSSVTRRNDRRADGRYIPRPSRRNCLIYGTVSALALAMGFTIAAAQVAG